MKRRRTGFTLIELLVALTVLSILLTLAAPSFREFTRNNRATATQNDLVTAMNMARSEALRRSRPVSVCASVDGASCGADTDWASGWIVFTDATGAAGDLDEDDELLQQWGAAGGDIVMAASTAFVQYQPTGMATAGATFDIDWSGCTGNNNRRIAVSASGAITSKKTAC